MSVVSVQSASLSSFSSTLASDNKPISSGNQAGSSDDSARRLPETLLGRSWELTDEQKKRATAFPVNMREATENSVNSFDIVVLTEGPDQSISHVGLVLESGGKKKVLESVPCVERDRYDKIAADEPSVREKSLEEFCRYNHICGRLIYVASPAKEVKPLLEGKEIKAMTDFIKKYEGKHYNRSMIEWESRRDKKYTCAEFVRAIINDQLPPGADIAAPKRMDFSEPWQEEFYRDLNDGQAPPRRALGVGPGDFIARGNYELQAKIDTSRFDSAHNQRK